MLERELYQTVEVYLNVDFGPKLKPQLGEHLAVAAITATEGPSSSGVWSRPDLALASLHRRKYQNSVQLDLYGFEVKRHGACDLKSVHEALAQRRFVNFSYLVWHYVDRDPTAQGFQSVRANCEAYGVGLITFSDPQDGRTFASHVTATRSNADPDLVDAFIEERFSEYHKRQLLNWLRGLGGGV